MHEIVRRLHVRVRGCACMCALLRVCAFVCMLKQLKVSYKVFLLT